jgi:hypothetical protein
MGVGRILCFFRRALSASNKPVSACSRVGKTDDLLWRHGFVPSSQSKSGTRVENLIVIAVSAFHKSISKQKYHEIAI